MYKVIITLSVISYSICVPLDVEKSVEITKSDDLYSPVKFDLATNVADLAKSKIEFVKTGKDLFSPQPKYPESAILEKEGPASAALSFTEKIQLFISSLWQPKPIVDTIREEDKYGNAGDKFYPVGRAVVGGVEGISNLASKALDYPFEAIKQITRGATEKLNNFGGRLVGL